MPPPSPPASSGFLVATTTTTTTTTANTNTTAAAAWTGSSSTSSSSSSSSSSTSSSSSSSAATETVAGDRVQPAPAAAALTTSPPPAPSSPAAPPPPTPKSPAPAAAAAAAAAPAATTAGAPLPLRRAGFLSRATYQWVQPFVATGYRRPLSEEDLWQLDGDLAADDHARRLADGWRAESADAAARGRDPHLWRALWRAFGREVAILVPYRLVADTTAVISPIVVLAIIQFLSDTGAAAAALPPQPAPDSRRAYALCAGLFLVQLVSAWTTHKYFEKGMVTGFRIRSALTSNLYLKCLRLSPRGRQKFSAGRIVNSMSTDTARMDRAAAFLHLVWSVPYLILVASALLVYNLGASALAGLAILLVFAPVQVFVMRRLSFIRDHSSSITDARVKITQEALLGVRVMKMYAWEHSFLDVIAGLRVKELKETRKLLLYRACIAAVTTVLPAIAAICTFVAYTQTGNTLTAPRVFSSLALFNILRIPCLLIPIIATDLTDAKVSLDRLNSIMLADELDAPPPVSASATKTSGNPGDDDGIAIRVAGAEFLWDVDDTGVDVADAADGSGGGSGFLKATGAGADASLGSAAAAAVAGGRRDGRFYLRGLDLAVPRGALVAVVGAVGAGKSSLLNALVGEMKRTKGSVTIAGSVGYCPQTAWIQNSTLRDNILFNRPFDAARYTRTLHACALAHDLSLLPAGDQTEIGERGINLSGGQRQRVSIARAAYFDADVVLLDDPLSAVDPHVGRWLFEKCIKGAMEGKTRVLVTHQLHVLPQVDYIYLMSEGRIVEHGTYAEMTKDEGSRFAELMNEYGSQTEGGEDDDDGGGDVAAADAAVVVAVAEATADGAAVGVGEKEKEKGEKRSTPDAAGATGGGKEGADGALVQEENRAIGNIGWRVFYEYMRASGGIPMALFTLLLLILAQLARIGTDLWLSWWLAVRFPLASYWYLDIYLLWGVLQILTSFASGIVFAYIGALAAKRLHDRALHRVFRAPLSFFDATPVGRVLNRFSRDVDTLDSLLPEAARLLGYTFSLVLGTVLLIVAVFPLFAVALAPAVVVYVVLQNYYRATSRELKRLDNVTRSPLFAHFSACFSGLTTIRAYGVEAQFAAKNRELLDWNNRAYYPLLLTQRWLGLRLELIGALLIFFAALFAIIARNSVGASVAGLAISYSLQVTGVLNWCVRVATDTEQNMVSAERLIEFDSLPSEAPEVIQGSRPPSGWPTRGAIEIRNLTLRYRPHLSPVLKGLTLTLPSGQKTAIVGRTGAGKSTLLLALLRLVEPSSGAILIDGVDVSTLGLHDLRRGVAVIPQDPVLFAGTLRDNLDPFGEHDDAAVWDALRRCGLEKAVVENPARLEMLVVEGGENWSTGQRQLICLARAMLKDAAVVVMDEATASVDLATDDFIQAAIRTDFADKTVVTIAHRLNTVIDYDAIVVLADGRVAERGSPAELLLGGGGGEDGEGGEGRGGVFRAMVEETGPANAAMLRAAVAMRAAAKGKA
ncbi:hypothetical protein DFJ73DRAFT_799177 [Zopfochytrium polystomum]|nr:hypothetical protein DFJ73DRAFT_799177 [Zopfochytrium polystomum]